MFRYLLKKFVLSVPFLKKKYIEYALRSGILVERNSLDIENATKVLLKKPLEVDFLLGLVKDDMDSIDHYMNPRSYFPKYERFFANNKISYEYYDIYAHDWLEKAKGYNAV